MSISVEFPHGAGGTWLSHIIHCTINNTEFLNSQVNWHESAVIFAQHNLSLEKNFGDNRISISSCNAKYNFWASYVKKRIIISYTTFFYFFIIVRNKVHNFAIIF